MKDKVINDLLKRISDLEFEVERLENGINKLENFIEREIELYTVELTEKNKNMLGYTAPIRGVYKEIYNVLQKLKGVDKE